MSDSVSRVVEGGLSMKIMWQALRGKWPWLLLAILAGAALGRFVHSTQATTYASEVRSSIRFVGARDATPPSADTLQARVLSYKDLAVSDDVAERVRRSMGLTEPPQELLKSIFVSAPTGTSDIIVKALRPTPSEAQRLADQWGSTLTAKVTEVEGAAPSAAGVIKLVRLTPASPALATKRIDPVVPVGVGALLGGIAAALWLVADARLRPRIYSSRQLTETLDAPVVTALPHLPERDVAEEHGNDRQFQEAITLLGSHLLGAGPTPALLVLASRPGAGASTVARWVARSFEDDGREVARFALPSDKVTLHQVLQVMERRDRCVVVDVPPVTGSAAAQALAAHADAVLLVLDARHSRLADAETAISRLTDAGARGLGLAVNHIGRTRRAAASYDVPYPTGSRGGER